ncbi:coiled-coil domain-containing protein 137, partial [Corapipo altera]|uniref:coiled-coil domain-containing protein 137 n=1 Tax=Corapipo altera TaxID=415028 RepID=UPI000FD64DFA
GPGQKQKPGQRPGQKLGPGQKAGPRSEHGQAVPRRSRKERKVDNMKPKHPEEQEIPFRLREIMQSREAMKRLGQGKRKAAEKKQQQKPKSKGDIPVPRFRRGKGESERSYICRMEQEVQHVLFLTENQLQREPEREDTAPEKSQRKKEFQKKKLEKARKKKEEKKVDMLEKSLFQDTVAFGEVVTQPPTITSRPRGRGPAEQAGRKRLLLTPRLGRSQASPVSPVSPVMSMARRRIVEEERARVIQAYRDIQRRKQLQRERSQAGHRALH